MEGIRTAGPSPRTVSVVLGVALGAFLDGIVFHQVLRWHHFVSEREPTDTVAGLDANTLADGLFHVFSYTVLLVAVWLLWRAGREGTMPSGRLLLGGVLLGAGLFNVADGVVLHFALGLHHLREGAGETVYDAVWLAINVGVAALGAAVVHRP